MNTRKIAAEFRLDHWAQVIHERTEKGLSVHAYCESIGIHENTYFYWQRKLREAACSGMPMPTVDSGEGTLVPKGWTALCVDNKPAQRQGLAVEVGGCRITVSTDTDTELLVKVCRALKAL